MKRTEPLVIAIDGPAASGKGTLARRLAARLDCAHLDTGLLYRAVGMKLADRGGNPTDVATAAAAAQALGPEDLDRPDLRTDTAASLASHVAAMAEVRRALLNFQRTFARHPPGGAKGAVLDGRDVGTVVCPDAAIKLFVTASEAVRARRRARELRERLGEAIHSDVLQGMKERDARDSMRGTAPLRVAGDAYVIDTSELDADEVLAIALAFVVARGFAEPGIEEPRNGKS